MIAIVDRIVSDQENVRISTNIHDRERKLSRQLWIINEKKIATDSNIYRFARRVRNFTTFADFSIISFTNRIMFDAKNCDGNRNTGAKNSIDRSSIRWSKESGLSTPYISTSVSIIHAISWSGQVRLWAGMVYLLSIDMIKLSKEWMSSLTFCLFSHCSSLYHTRFLTTLLVNWMTTMFDERLLQIHVNVAIELS